MVELPPSLPSYAHVTEEAVQCIAAASSRYQVPELLLHAVLKKENGRLGTESKNRNGTYDLGPAQINTVWLKQLSAYGIKREHLRDDFCTNVLVSAYILKDFNRIKKGNWFDTIVAYNIGPYKWTDTRYKIGHKYATDVVSYWWGFQKYVDEQTGVVRENLPQEAKLAKAPHPELKLGSSQAKAPSSHNLKAKESSESPRYTMEVALNTLNSPSKHKSNSAPLEFRLSK